MKNKKGFTLIELIIVFSIMSIIAAIAVPKFSNIIDSQEKKACIENRKIIMEHYNFQKCIDESITLGAILDNSTDYFKEEISCPSGGDYSVSNGAIFCNFHDDLVEDGEEDEDGTGDEGDGDDNDGEEENSYKWSPAKTYKKDDVVIHNGLIYLAHNDEVGNNNCYNIKPGTNGSHWIEITIPDWSLDNSYSNKNVVKHEKSLYRAKGNPQNTQPGSSNKWIKIGGNINNMDDFLDLLN